MADDEQVEIVKLGARSWNSWRKDNPDAEVNLSEADLSDADLRYADLSDAGLSMVDLSGADLRGANLSITDLRHALLIRTNLSEAILRHSNLSAANLTGAELGHADLRWARLYGTILSNAHLSRTNLIDAELYDTVLVGLDLRHAIGLDDCHHRGPSVIDIRTLMRSGSLPLPFLRGCGLPDIVIEYLPSLVGSPVEFYSCFISDSTDDQTFAERLHADLQNKGVRCWFAPHDIRAGRKIHEQIDEAIRHYDKLLLILSSASLNSQWVKTEIAKARKRETRENRRMLFPVRLVDFETLQDWECFDSDTGKDSAQEIREYFIPDFSRWKDYDAYTVGFDRLLRDLKADEPDSSG
jgi:uncharacterized protein YjbI with pentapeptide repeats